MVAEPPMIDSGGMTSDTAMLGVALEEAAQGMPKGGVPVGAALFSADGTLLGRGRNRRVQDGDPSSHGETAAFRERRAAGPPTATRRWRRRCRPAGTAAA